MENTVRPSLVLAFPVDPWRLTLRAEAALVGLCPADAGALERRLEAAVFAPSVPEGVRGLLSGESLRAAVRAALEAGVEAAAAVLELTLGLVLAGAQAVALERAGLVGPAVRAALEHALGDVVPEVGAAARARTRQRLRAALAHPGGSGPAATA